MLRGVEVVGILVAAQNVDGIAADAHARAGNQSLIDGVANGGIGGACALGAHVALGGEAGHEVGFGGLFGQNHAPRDRLLHGLQVLSAGMEKEMHVRVDQAGDQRGVAEVDDLRALRMLDRRADGANALAFDEDLAGLEHPFRCRPAASRAACSTMGAEAGCCAAAARTRMPERETKRRTFIILGMASTMPHVPGLSSALSGVGFAE